MLTLNPVCEDCPELICIPCAYGVYKSPEDYDCDWGLNTDVCPRYKALKIEEA